MVHISWYEWYWHLLSGVIYRIFEEGGVGWSLMEWCGICSGKVVIIVEFWREFIDSLHNTTRLFEFFLVEVDYKFSCQYHSSDSCNATTMRVHKKCNKDCILRSKLRWKLEFIYEKYALQKENSNQMHAILLQLLYLTLCRHRQTNTVVSIFSLL
jgi:hypothetical protein